MEETPVEALERERRRVNKEIRNYPTPIAGCDAQFNSLLEKRKEIEQRLSKLKIGSKRK